MSSNAWRPIGDNNFDLIRLLAAAEVAVVHAISALNLGPDPALLHIIPGVPVFFLISGYLIFPSFNNNGRLARYSAKRASRIYPALFVCFALCVFVLTMTGQMAGVDFGEFLVWTAAQLTFVQFYNPQFLRDFGTGALNGSLWTISVELQFYVLTPLLAWCVRRWKWLWGPLIAAFALANVTFVTFDDGSSLSKLAMVTFAPWLYMFLIGAWLSTRRDLVDAMRRVPLPWFLASFAIVASVTWSLGLPLGTNGLNPLMFLAMAALIIRLAYTVPHLSAAVLRGVDLSYGIYIYHMPVLNLLLWAGLAGSVGAGALGLAATVCLAALSWFAVERPALALVHRTSKPPEGSRMEAGSPS